MAPLLTRTKKLANANATQSLVLKISFGIKIHVPANAMVLVQSSAQNLILTSICKSAPAFVLQKTVNTTRFGTKFFALVAVFQSYVPKVISSTKQNAIANASLKYAKLDSTGIKKIANAHVSYRKIARLKMET